MATSRVALTSAGSTQDKLLLATANLLTEAAGGPVSTRDICEHAGVTAPTLYHHFGSKQGLVDAVMNFGFGQYMSSRESAGLGADPLADLRAGWDHHVGYGLENPAFYALMYGNVRPGAPCAIASVAHSMLLERLRELGEQGRLRVTPVQAAARFAAANVGVTLALIAQPADARDQTMSDSVRDALIDSILTTTSPASDEVAGRDRLAASAISLRAALDDSTPVSPGERALLEELLDRLAGSIPQERTTHG